MKGRISLSLAPCVCLAIPKRKTYLQSLYHVDTAASSPITLQHTEGLLINMWLVTVFIRLVILLNMQILGSRAITLYETLLFPEIEILWLKINTNFSDPWNLPKIYIVCVCIVRIYVCVYIYTHIYTFLPTDQNIKRVSLPYSVACSRLYMLYLLLFISSWSQIVLILLSVYNSNHKNCWSLPSV